MKLEWHPESTINTYFTDLKCKEEYVIKLEVEKLCKSISNGVVWVDTHLIS